MANIGVSAIKLIDSDGDALDDGDGKLNVNIASIVPGIGATNLGKGEDIEHVTGDVGVMTLAVRRDVLTSMSNLDGDYTPLAVNSTGALYVNIKGTGTTESLNIGGQSVSASQYGSPTLVKMNEEVSAPGGHGDNEWSYLQVDLNGSLYTTHGVTGGADGVTTDDTSGQVLGGDVACKKVDIQAQTDNTGVIAVGFTGVDATVATGTGILLYAGDVYSLEINNLNLIYIQSSESGEGVRYTYFT